MYHWVTDKQFLNASYSLCSNLVNQLVQELKHYDIEARMNVVGSKSRNMVTQDDNKPIDFDFNLLIVASMYNDKELCEIVQEAFDYVLNRNGYGNCGDSTSVFTTKKMRLKTGNKTQFSIDVCLIKEDRYGWHRLIHNKTGIVARDTYIWQQGQDLKEIKAKEQKLKEDTKNWNEVRDTYLRKKNLYLSRQDTNHKSFNCYIEAVNEVYHKCFGAINVCQNGFYQITR